LKTTQWRDGAYWLSGLNCGLLLWLWLPMGRGLSKVALPLRDLVAITVVYLLSLSMPFILAKSYQWQAWRVAGHWSLAWAIYSVTLVGLPSWFQASNAKAVGLGLILGIAGILCVDAPRNHLFGIRVVWTYQSPTIWRKTNTLGGWLIVASGLMGIGLSHWQPSLVPVFSVTLVVLAGLIAIGYAYWLSHRIQA